MARSARYAGWLLIAGGVAVIAVVVYQGWFTNALAASEQRDLARQWEALMAAPVPADSSPPEPTGRDTPERSSDQPARLAGEPDDHVAAPSGDDLIAAMWFERDGRRILSDGPMYVVNSAGWNALRRGPGHYPSSAKPGHDGNLAIAGHRSTYGAPFADIDQLREGDTIHVMDRSGTTSVYIYREQRIVDPEAMWVIGRDPLNLGAPTITLTTCHPRHSSRQRLIVWGELVVTPDPPASPTEVFS